MPLASSGLRALPAPRTLGSMARSIHMPAFIPRPVPKPAGSFAQTVFKHTRTLLSRLVTQLAAPGAFAPAAHVQHTIPIVRLPLFSQATSLNVLYPRQIKYYYPFLDKRAYQNRDRH